MKKLINDHPLLKTTVVLNPDLDRSATFTVDKIAQEDDEKVKVHLIQTGGRSGYVGKRVSVVLPRDFTKQRLERCDNTELELDPS